MIAIKNWSIEFLRTIEKSDESRIIKNQLTRSATSCGANFEEGQGAICSKLHKKATSN
ncbi:MAG TPA: four helix bundle protein [Flavobacteriales bacterium]|nr:four helix bundle protein [Flavobacteriales bacterium]